MKYLIFLLFVVSSATAQNVRLAPTYGGTSSGGYVPVIRSSDGKLFKATVSSISGSGGSVTSVDSLAHQPASYYATASQQTTNTTNIAARYDSATAKSRFVDFTSAQTIPGLKTFGDSIRIGAASLGIQTGAGTFFGIGAGGTKRLSGTGSDDLFMGYLAGQSVPSGQTHSTAVGVFALTSMTSGAGATAVGQKSFATATSVVSSVGIGGKTGANLPSAAQDFFGGYGAAFWSDATNLGYRTFLGFDAGMYDNGDYNIYVGAYSGKQNSVNTTATSYNIGVGVNTLNSINSGAQHNIAVGREALYNATSPEGAIGMGYQAAYNTTTGRVIAIGRGALFNNTTGANDIALGEGAGSDLPSTASSNYFVAGSGSSANNARIDTVLFGRGWQNATPGTINYMATAGSGTNISGASINLITGKSTGSASGADFNIYTSDAGSSGTSLQSATVKFTVKGTGVINVATAPSISGGSYDLVTRNSSNGNIEKIPSSSFIINSVNPQTSSNFSIDGTGAIATSLTVPLIYGSTASAGTLNLSSTSNGTKGTIKLGANSAYDEVNKRLGIGTISPTVELDVKGSTVLTASAAHNVLAVNQATPGSFNADVWFQASGSTKWLQTMRCTSSTYDLWFYNGSASALTLFNSSANVGIGTTTDIATAILNISSTTKGMLTPRMTTTQRDAIASPPEGLEIYNLTSHAKEFYNGTAWKTVTTL